MSATSKYFHEISQSMWKHLLIRDYNYNKPSYKEEYISSYLDDCLIQALHNITQTIQGRSEPDILFEMFIQSMVATLLRFHKKGAADFYSAVGDLQRVVRERHRLSANRVAEITEEVFYETHFQVITQYIENRCPERARKVINTVTDITMLLNIIEGLLMSNTASMWTAHYCINLIGQKRHGLSLKFLITKILIRECDVNIHVKRIMRLKIGHVERYLTPEEVSQIMSD